MSATSLEGARHLSDIAKTSPRHENYSKKGILVGGSERNEVQLSKQDVDLIKSKFTGSSTSSGEVLVPEIALAYEVFFYHNKVFKVRAYCTGQENMFFLR